MASGFCGKSVKYLFRGGTLNIVGMGDINNYVLRTCVHIQKVI